jgi:hypothetical protein
MGYICSPFFYLKTSLIASEISKTIIVFIDSKITTEAIQINNPIIPLLAFSLGESDYLKGIMDL